MKSSTTFLLALLIFIVTAATVNAGYFRDDRGREFNFVGKPKVVTRAATGAMSLYHMGMREDQITAVFGLWSIRGSDLDVDNPEAGSRYPESDPTPEEVEWLQGLINLSPSCYTNPRGCSRWDNTSIVEQYKSEYDYILFIDNGNDRNFRTIENETGIPVVFVDTFYEYSPDCRPDNITLTDEMKFNCYGRSMIDIAKRIEELAIALNADVDTERIERDKQAACEAAWEFTDTMKQKQEEGVRFVHSINAIKKDDDGNDFFEFRTLDPVDLWIPRTLEELGMPILHHDELSLTLETISTRMNGTEYFTDCPEGELSASCNSNTKYPVDFWLWDSRSYLNIIGVEPEILESIFPDKAILAGQHWHYARNDGSISYDAIARMLTKMTEKVKFAQRLHDRTPCVNIDPKTAVTAQAGGGLDRNEYICYNETLIQREYLTCDRPVGGDGTGEDGSEDSGSGFELCFSGSSMVKLEDNTVIQISDLQIGDRVQVTKDGKLDTVYSFGHYQPDSVSEYLSIQSTAKAAPITISAPHMLFLDSRKAVPASSIKVGDVLLGGNTVTKVDKVSLVGAYAPFTYSGSIVVNEVVASNYVSLTGTSTFLGIDMQFIAHTAVGARRVLCQLNLCEEKYSNEGIATWIPYHTAAWIASQEVSIAFLVVAACAIVFARRCCQKVVM